MSAEGSTDQPDILPKRTNNITSHQRTYKACIPCRNRKAKCDLGETGVPPCARCRREMRECIFSIDRSSSGRKRRRSSKSPIRDDNHISPENSDVQIRPRVTSIVNSTPKDGSDSGDIVPRNDRNSYDLGNYFGSEKELGSSVIRTVVSSGNDALKILFEAATQEDDTGIDSSPREVDHRQVDDHVPTGRLDNSRKSYSSKNSNHPNPADLEQEALEVWSNFRFVRMGWFTAYEAMTYIDLFFKNMWPLSPILTNVFSTHDMHRQLVTVEPLLCCTILMISSRYHTLPGPNGHSRSFFIHDQLWEHCQRMIMRIIFGEGKGTHTKTRTIGSVEALLLVSEWHPRSLHYPPKTDDWGDADLMIPEMRQSSTKDHAPGQRWLDDVVEPARKSNRMSWMLLGSAVSLAHELDVFRDDEKGISTSSENETFSTRRLRIRRLLYIYTNQLASRLGCTSMYPQNMSNPNILPSSTAQSARWDTLMSSWTELTKLLKSWSDLVFPSATTTKHLLQSGRYVSLLEHYKPLIGQWRQKHLNMREGDMDIFQAMLVIEFEHLRIHCNSIGMQAVCERSLAEVGFDTDFAISADSVDHECIQEVIEGGCSILKTLVTLAEADVLRFAPVRIFLRVTTASIYLLKAISLGVRNGQLLSTFNLLDYSIKALRSSNLDEMHLALRYATLLETHVTRLRRGFQRSSKPTFSSMPSTRHTLGENTRSQNMVDIAPAALDECSSNGALEASGTGDGSNDFDTFLQSMSADDWLSLPFDPSMAPFNTNDAQAFPSAFDDTALDFIWNIPT